MFQSFHVIQVCLLAIIISFFFICKLCIIEYSNSNRFPRQSSLWQGRKIQFLKQLKEAKYVVPDCGDEVDYGIGLSYRPVIAYVACWRAGKRIFAIVNCFPVRD